MWSFFQPAKLFIVPFAALTINQIALADECVTKEDQISVYGYDGLDDDLKAHASARSAEDEIKAEKILLEGLDRDALTNFGKRTYLDALANYYFSEKRFDEAIAMLRRIKDDNLTHFENEDAAISARMKDLEKSKTSKRAKPVVRLPVYPKRVNKSAHCWFSFDVSAKSSIENIEELYCTDKKFRKYAKKTIGKFKFRPAWQDGKMVADTGITTKISYRLLDKCGTIIPEIRLE